jgi:hypothetical protein
MRGIRLDQHTLQIQLPEELLEYSPLMVFARGIAGLSDRHTKGGRIKRDLCQATLKTEPLPTLKSEWASPGFEDKSIGVTP